MPKTLEDVLNDPKSFTSKVARKFANGEMKPIELKPQIRLKEAKLTKKEQAALDRSLRVSKRRRKSKSNKRVSIRDEAQTPPYALLPLLPYIPREYIIWESASSKWGFLGEAIRVLRGNQVIETGLELDGTDFLKAHPLGNMQITNPPYSNPLKFEWIERSYDNRQPFALLMPLETWGAARAQKQFQRFGMSIIILNRRVNFHMPYAGWGGSSADYPVAWFTWGLGITTEVVYGHIPLEKHLPEWMVRPAHKNDITRGARSIKDKLAIRHAINPLQWSVPTRGVNIAGD